MSGLILGLSTSPPRETFYRDLARAQIESGVRRDREGFRVLDGPVVDFHALRATYATSLARADVPLVLAQRLMRHSTPALTANVYTKLELHDGREAVARIDTPAPATSRSGNLGADLGGVPTMQTDLI